MDRATSNFDAICPTVCFESERDAKRSVKMNTLLEVDKIARMIALVDDLRALPAETNWVEFKENNTNPDVIGVRISALSNAARLADQHFAYMVWRIKDGDHVVVGTNFEPSAEKKQQEPLDFWLAKRLNPSIAFSFSIVLHRDGRLVLLEIPAATTSPIEFDRQSYIRIGSATPRLSDYPQRLQALWTKLQPYAWESGDAAQFLDSDTVLSYLDYTSYFDLTGQTLPDNRSGIFSVLEHESLIRKDVGDRWNITNLGAALFAKDFSQFDHRVARKAVRFVAYDGASRADTVIDRLDSRRGYANGFKYLIDHIHAILPKNEHIDTAFRTQASVYPSIAIRELVANALIHQDMTITGSGPLIELFKDRLEITNPGEPLINPDRFIDLPPRSRNEGLASLMRRMHICEEEGTGIDKTIRAVELFQLPPPDFRVEGDATRVVLYAPRKFGAMTVEERVRACYQHAVLCFVSGNRMKNATLRERFGIGAGNAAQVSQVIRQALDQNLIRPADPERPQAAYVPAWA